MAVRKLKASWWIDITFNDTRYRKRSPENSRLGALAYEAVLRQRLARGEPIDKAETQPGRGVLFENFALRWFEEYVIPNNKFSEQRIKWYTLQSSLIPFFGKMPVEEIKTHHVEQYKALRVKDGLANKSIRKSPNGA